jgi:elongation factor Ts
LLRTQVRKLRRAWPPGSGATLFFCRKFIGVNPNKTGSKLAKGAGKREIMTVSEKIDAKLVKELREKSGAPMGDCLKALQETKGNIEDAFVVLRKRGMASAQKKASRTTNDGSVYPYIHAGGKLGVLIEVNCESDFVARTEDFQELLKDIAMHIAASDPRYVKPEDVTPEDLEREKDIFRAQAAATGKPAPVIEKIVDGKMAKFYEEVCLLEQPFIKDQAISIKELIAQKVGKLGENITVRRFARFKVGAPDWTVAQTKAVEAAAE